VVFHLSLDGKMLSFLLPSHSPPFPPETEPPRPRPLPPIFFPSSPRATSLIQVGPAPSLDPPGHDIMIVVLKNSVVMCFCTFPFQRHRPASTDHFFSCPFGLVRRTRQRLVSLSHEEGCSALSFFCVPFFSRRCKPPALLISHLLAVGFLELHSFFHNEETRPEALLGRRTLSGSPNSPPSAMFFFGSQAVLARDRRAFLVDEVKEYISFPELDYLFINA